jgi:predicted transcriptional regulator
VTDETDDTLELAGKVIAAYVRNNAISAADLPAMMISVHAAFAGERGGPSPVAGAPAVPIKKSVTPGYLVCLEDGKRLKILKRYLRTRYKLSPEQYRSKWGLPHDYPMVAANYSARRSEYAKASGLGKVRAPLKKRVGKK